MPTSERSGKIERMEQAFEKWRESHPDGRFRDFYVAKVTAQLDAGKPHATLGPKLKGVERWEDSGRDILGKFENAGLRPEDTFVDYGCGSLRLGQHFIRYLEPGNYWGLDITDRFMNDGIEMLGPELIKERRPNLRVIAPDTLREAAAARPKFLVALAVLIHVAEEELDEFLDELMTVVTADTTAFLSFKAADTVLRYSGRSWAYPETLLEERLSRRGAAVEFEMSATPAQGEEEDGIRRGWMRIQRRPVTT